MSAKLDLTGQRYGRLVVLEEAESSKYKHGYRQRRWLCQCDCGNKKVVWQNALRDRRAKSCGCLIYSTKSDGKLDEQNAVRQEGKITESTLCWSCDKATGGCSWSKQFKPVPGWDAVRNDVLVQYGSGEHSKRLYDESYVVKACPEFVPDKPRDRERSWMSEMCIECNSIDTCMVFGPICKKKKGL